MQGADDNLRADVFLRTEKEQQVLEEISASDVGYFVARALAVHGWVVI